MSDVCRSCRGPNDIDPRGTGLCPDCAIERAPKPSFEELERMGRFREPSGVDRECGGCSCHLNPPCSHCTDHCASCCPSPSNEGREEKCESCEAEELAAYDGPTIMDPETGEVTLARDPEDDDIF